MMSDWRNVHLKFTCMPGSVWRGAIFQTYKIRPTSSIHGTEQERSISLGEIATRNM